ncbi:COQ9 family protein [Pelagibius litoralis]|uniref:COQ9 family protein n=1 Tax=Pelagibius litoralis TaxID=374515 RepID=A0A967EXA1_9PROT|nr:COQ9 family protein [Pelagibius litoralis]NIA68480.1 COQ9 family protein [Pelagibius litoralis]
MTDDKQRLALLDQTLRHVPFDGWTWQAIDAAARDLEMDLAEARRLYPGGPEEMIRTFSNEADRQMMAGLERLDLASMKVREKVTAGVRLRLEALAAHREAARRALAFFAMPQNAAGGLRCLYRTVDAIWYAAGDTATDYNFYTKRALLSGVYTSTLLYWLNDKSDDYTASWAFLDRRIAEVLKVAGRLGKGVSAAMNLPDRLFERFAEAGGGLTRSRSGRLRSTRR